jgi:hypothetical protein
MAFICGPAPVVYQPLRTFDRCRSYATCRTSGCRRGRADMSRSGAMITIERGDFGRHETRHLKHMPCLQCFGVCEKGERWCDDIRHVLTRFLRERQTIFPLPRLHKQQTHSSLCLNPTFLGSAMHMEQLQYECANLQHIMCANRTCRWSVF